jgi:hypothetical protein
VRDSHICNEFGYSATVCDEHVWRCMFGSWQVSGHPHEPVAGWLAPRFGIPSHNYCTVLADVAALAGVGHGLHWVDGQTPASCVLWHGNT